MRKKKLREKIFHEIENTSNDLRVHTDATNFEFRKRMYEMRRAKEELEYQMRTTREEIEEQVGQTWARKGTIMGMTMAITGM